MAYDLAQAYYLNGFSLYNFFGVGVEGGSDDLLKFPERKDSTSHDWPDEHGTDIDLSRVFLKSREATFRMWLLADSEDDFWMKYNTFHSYITKPDLLRLTITELGKDFFVYYVKTSVLTRLTRIKETSQVGLKFTITFVEQDPTSSRIETFLVTQADSLIIV